MQEIFSERDTVEETFWRLNRIIDCSKFAGNPTFRDNFETQMIALIEKEIISEASTYLSEKINLIRYQTIAQYVEQKGRKSLFRKIFNIPHSGK